MKTVHILSFVLVLFLLFPPLFRFSYAAVPFGATQGGKATLADVLEEALPAVVNIAAKAKTRPSRRGGYSDPFQDPFFDDPLFRHFFRDFQFERRGFGAPEERRQQLEREAQSIGSGVIVDAQNGYILTNYHVIRNAETLFVILKDKRKLSAEIVGFDPDTDIAVLKVEAEGLTALPMGNSDLLRVGDYVAAIGNPFGLSHTVTSGIVSALGRSNLGIESYEDFIQTDASINPGNSGGALVSFDGKLVGINTAIYSRSGGNMGIGFAIPVSMAKRVMDQLIEHGKVSRGQIGVMIQDVTSDLVEAFGLKEVGGVLVTQITEGGAAGKAGIRSGDIITHLDGTLIKDGAHLRNLVGLMRLGSTMKVRFLRDGKQEDAILVIEESGETQEARAVDSVRVLKGAKFSSVPSDHALYGKVKGVHVAAVERDSPAWRSGLREGDIILSVNQQPVETVDALVENAAKKSSILFNIRRGSGALFIVIR